MQDDSNSIQVEVSESVAEQQAAEAADNAADQALKVTSTEKTDEATDGKAGDATNEAGEQQPEAEEHEDVPYGVKKKLGKLTARVKERDEKIRERDAEIEHWRNLALKGQAGSSEASPATEEEAPTLESCGNDVDVYIQKSVQHGIKQARLIEQQEAQKRSIVEAQQKRITTFQERSKAFEDENPDYRAVVFAPNVRISEPMAEAIQELENGPAVAYFLGKNPDEALRISNLSPTKQAIEMAKLEDKIASPTVVDDPDDEGRPAQRVITSAPPPVKTLNPSAPVKKALADLPMSEYVAERNKARKNTGGFL